MSCNLKLIDGVTPLYVLRARGSSKSLRFTYVLDKTKGE